MSPHVKTLFLPQPSGSFGIWCKGHESMDPSCLWSKVQAGAGRDVRSPIEHLCDVMRRKILLQDVQMMTATFFIPSCTTSFFKLLFWLSSIMFNSSLVNSFISCTLLYFCCFLKTQIIFILYLFILVQENPLLFFFLLNVSNLLLKKNHNLSIFLVSKTFIMDLCASVWLRDWL